MMSTDAETMGREALSRRRGLTFLKFPQISTMRDMVATTKAMVRTDETEMMLKASLRLRMQGPMPWASQPEQQQTMVPLPRARWAAQMMPWQGEKLEWLGPKQTKGPVLGTWL